LGVNIAGQTSGIQLTAMWSSFRNRKDYFLIVPILFTALVLPLQINHKDLAQEAPNPLQHKKFHLDSSCDGVDGGGGTMAIACPAATYPFALSLLSVEPTEIPIGGDTTILLRWTNVGHDPESVPWTTDPDLIELPDENGSYEYLEADLTANLMPANGSAYFRIPVRLYGAKEVEGSLQQINPGESVDITIKLVLDCKSEDLHCKFLSPGATKLSVTWSEYKRSAVYQKCRIDNSSTRLRELRSNASNVVIVSAPSYDTNSNRLVSAW
jgi:hypothetical protein